MRKSGVVWSEQTLAAYIRRPDDVVPGTSMRFNGWAYGDQKLADLFAYLRTFPPTHGAVTFAHPEDAARNNIVHRKRIADGAAGL